MTMPMDRKKYPKDWPAIRKEVLERAGHKCQQCGVPNYSRGRRALDGSWVTEKEMGGLQSDDGYNLFGDFVWRVSKIVLTCAHLDHDTTNNGTPGNRPNLRAWCQRCHLAHDYDLHRTNARRTNEKKKGMQRLF